MGFRKTFGLVAFLTVLSKLLGQVRDSAIAAAYGLGPVVDGFNYANMVTGNIFVLFGGVGGPFHQSTVAIFAPEKDRTEVRREIFQLVSVVALILAIVALMVSYLLPYSTHLITYFKPPNEDAWLSAVRQAQLMSPLIFLSGIAGILYGVSNIYGQYVWPSLSPALMSLSLILFVVFWRDAPGLCLAYGSVVGALCQVLSQLPAAAPRLRWHFSWRLAPSVQSYFKILLPAFVATGVGTLTVYVDALFASAVRLGPEFTSGAGAWTSIVNANRLVQLPLGILLTAMLVPILPRFAEQASTEKIVELKADYRRGLRALWFLSIPIAAILVVIGKPIIQLLYEHGKFTALDTGLLTEALCWLAPCILFYVGRDLITRVFFAFKDTKTTFHVALAALAIKATLNLVLVGPLGVGGISLSTTLMSLINFGVLSFFLRRKIGLLGYTSLIKPLGIILFSSFAAAVTARLVQEFVIGAVTGSIGLALSLVSALLSAGLVYLAVCHLLRLQEVAFGLNMVRARLRL